MIKISGQCENKKDHRARCLDIGFQFLAFRHQHGLRLRDIARRTGCTITELDKFELGSADIEVFLCLYHFYNQKPDLDGNPWEIEIK